MTTISREELKKEWIAALRSGKYAQRTEFLHTKIDGVDKFCCLGVLCDLAVKHGILPAPNLETEIITYGDLSDYGRSSSAVLPLKLQEFMGVDSNQFEVGRHSKSTLTALNDCTKTPYTFEKLADIIEKI